MTTLASLRFFDVVLFLHITSVVIAFGVLFTYPIVVPLTVRNAPRQVAWLHEMQVAVGRTVVTPAAALILLTGIYLAADADVFSKWWVTVPLIAIIVILGLGGAYSRRETENWQILPGATSTPPGRVRWCSARNTRTWAVRSARWARSWCCWWWS